MRLRLPYLHILNLSEDTYLIRNSKHSARLEPDAFLFAFATINGGRLCAIRADNLRCAKCEKLGSRTECCSQCVHQERHLTHVPGVAAIIGVIRRVSVTDVAWRLRVLQNRDISNSIIRRNNQPQIQTSQFESKDQSSSKGCLPLLCALLDRHLPCLSSSACCN